MVNEALSALTCSLGTRVIVFEFCESLGERKSLVDGREAKDASSSSE